MKGLYTIYNQRLAGYLMMQGFPILRIMQNSKTGKDNYLFANTELLHDHIDKWQIDRLKTKTEQQNN